MSSSSPDQVLKAVQSSPGGLREVAFYEKISTSSDPELQQWRDLAPKFHGLKNVTKEDGTTSQYMILGRYFKIITLYCILTISFRKFVWGDDQALCNGHQGGKYLLQ